MVANDPAKPLLVLRDYQQQVIIDTRKSLRKHKRVLIRLPTGGGKTVIAAKMAETASLKGFTVFFICHRDFLLGQTAGTFDDAGLSYGFVARGWPWQPHRLIQICSIDTLKNRLDRVRGPKLCIWDEAHHLAAAGWAKVMEWCGPDCLHVGLSATPQRRDGKGLSAFFDDMVLGPTEAWLIERGFLSKYKLFAPSTPDLTGIHMRAGDYATDELETAMDTKTIVGDLVKHWRLLANGKRSIYFGVSIKHSQHIAAAFREAGIMALHLDGDTPTNDRKAAAIDFAQGNINILTNCGLFGEGYDLAAQAKMPVTIDCVGDCAPTFSLAAHQQKNGRAARPKEDGSAAIFLDHAGNWKRHGFFDDEREWSLEGRQKKGDGEGGGPITRQCPQCFHIHRASPSCPSCGHVYVIEARKIEEVDGELKQIDATAIRHAKKMEEWHAKSLDELIDIGVRRGFQYPEQWAARLWTMRAAKAKDSHGHIPQQMAMFNDPL